MLTDIDSCTKIPRSLFPASSCSTKNNFPIFPAVHILPTKPAASSPWHSPHSLCVTSALAPHTHKFLAADPGHDRLRSNAIIIITNNNNQHDTPASSPTTKINESHVKLVVVVVFFSYNKNRCLFSWPSSPPPLLIPPASERGQLL